MRDRPGSLQEKNELLLDWSSTWRILNTTLLGFACYLTIGLTLAAMSKFVHQSLGFNLIVAGLAISLQSLSTVLFRPWLGRISDRIGPKKIVVRGLAACAVSGFVLVPAARLAHTPLAALAFILVSRVMLGCGEGAVATGATAWGLARVPRQHASHVISWAGVASYGAIALGAPLGLWLAADFGVAWLGTAVGCVGLAGCWLAANIEPAAVYRGESLPIAEVARRMMPYGTALALATGGFAIIATFVTLYFHNRGWAYGALPVSLFGGCFVLVRLAGARMIHRHGGLNVAMASMLVECAGLGLLAHAHTAAAALLGAAVSGAGFALVFPAIGIEAVRQVAPSDRGAALGVYTAFLDLSLGITGPLAGVAIHHWGYGAGFALASAAAFAGALTVCLAIPAAADAEAEVSPQPRN